MYRTQGKSFLLLVVLATLCIFSALQAESTLNFPRLSFDPFTFTGIAIVNPTDQDATVTLTAYGEDGQPLAGVINPTEIMVAANQQFTLEGNNYRPLWTPDGERITFASDRDGPTSIYWQAADGRGVPERLTTAEEGTYHWPDSWSPDGNTLAFRMESNADNGPNYSSNEMDIWTLPLDGGVPGEPEVFSARIFPFQEVGASFSPDGRWLAYAGGDAITLEFKIYVEPFPPTGERRLVSRDLGIMPLWSRDGRELFYRTVNQSGIDPQTLRKISVSTNPAFTFTSEETVPIGEFMSFGYYRSFDVTPDGESFLVVLPPEQTGSGTAQPQINIVLNWFEELKERVPVP